MEETKFLAKLEKTSQTTALPSTSKVLFVALGLQTRADELN
jgi:hypothetical protein